MLRCPGVVSFSEPVDDRLSELRALHFGRAFHQPGEVVRHDLVGDGRFERTHDWEASLRIGTEFRRLLPIFLPSILLKLMRILQGGDNPNNELYTMISL